MVFWQCGHQVRINATTTTLPWYWLSSTCLPPLRLMASSGDLRGTLIASTAGAVRKSRARAGARNRRFRHKSQSIAASSPSTLVTMAPFRRSSKRPSSPEPVTESAVSEATDIFFHFFSSASR